MAYTVIKNFERGLDKRRLIDTTELGGLLDAKDCHVTRGGEIEKRAAFINTTAVPATTKGFYATSDPLRFHVWGDAATAPGGMPALGVYHSIPNTTTGSPLSEILSVEEFGGKLYVIAKYVDGTILHWYDNGLLRQPPILVTPPGGGPPEPVAGPQPGNPTFEFILSLWGTTGTPQLAGLWVQSLAGSPEPTTGFIIPDVRMPLVEPIDPLWRDTLFHLPYADMTLIGTTVDEWAAEIAQAINDCPEMSDPDPLTPASPKWRALANGPKVTVWAEEIATRFNGYKVVLSGNRFTWTPYDGAVSGGTGPVTPVLLVAPLLDPPGTPAPMNPGSYVLAHNERLFATSGQYVNYSSTRVATEWPPGQGDSGFIDLSTWAEGTPFSVSLADFGGDLAIFCRRHIIVYHVDFLIGQSFKRQTLHRTGIVAPHARVPFGQGEVMYLDRSGIRSLRSRSGFEQGFAADVGEPIDELVRAKVLATPTAERPRKFWAEVEPRSARLWMALYDVIYVLSYYPGTQIAAWTYYDASSCPVDMMNATDEYLFWRSGNNIFAYGGISAVPAYDATEARARLPYIDGGKPATVKGWSALDLAAFGTWGVYASFNPQGYDTLDLLANITQSTYAQQKVAVNGQSPACSLELRTTYVGPARIGNASLHYDDSFSD